MISRRKRGGFGCWMALGVLVLLQACGMSGDSNTGSTGLQPFGFIGASNLENDGFTSMDPQIAMEGDLGGTAIAVWVKQVDADPFDEAPAISHVYAKRHDGTKWISTTDAACPADGRIENTDADGICIIDAFTATESAISPRISMDDNGDAMVVWQQNDGSSKRVYARFFDASTPAWGSEIELNDTSDFAALDGAGPAIAMEPDGGGTAMAVWSQFRSGDDWQAAARGYSGGVWATADATTGCTAGGANGADDGICILSGGSPSLPLAEAPKVAMDNAGKAIAAYVRIKNVGNCFDNEDTFVSLATRADQTSVTCQDTGLVTNNFDGTTWGGPVDRGINAPTSVTADPCFLDGNGNSVAGILSGGVTSCVTVGQVQLAMDRAGNGFVVVKAHWNETEALQNNTAGCSTGGSNGNNRCDSGGHSTNATGFPPNNAQDAFNGNVIYAIRYDGTAWGTPQALFAHENQPSSSVSDGGSARFYNCTGSGLVTTETNRVLVECQVNIPQIALSGDGSGTAVAVWERFDGTNHDVFADCFSLTNSTTCGGAAATGWRSSFATPALGAASSSTWTPPYGILNDTTISREAYSPQIVMDSTGNGRAVWTQRNASDRQWRIYSMQFRSGFTAEQIGSGGNDNGICEGGETCQELIGDLIGNDDGACTGGETCFNGFDHVTQGTPIDGYAGGNLSYGNPVIAMQWANPANGAGGNCPGGSGVNCGNAMTLFLESDLSTLSASGTFSSIDVQARANRWVPP